MSDCVECPISSWLMQSWCTLAMHSFLTFKWPLKAWRPKDAWRGASVHRCAMAVYWLLAGAEHHVTAFPWLPCPEPVTHRRQNTVVKRHSDVLVFCFDTGFCIVKCVKCCVTFLLRNIGSFLERMRRDSIVTECPTKHFRLAGFSWNLCGLHEQSVRQLKLKAKTVACVNRHVLC